MLSPRHTRFSVVRALALVLACAAVPAGAQVQDTLKVPAASTPRVNLPGGTTLSRPPVNQPAATAPAATVGTAQQLVTVPDLDGRTVDEARRLLAAAGLELGRVAEGSGGGTPGTVMQQQPRGGSVVAPKSDVRLWLVPETVASNTVRPPVLSRPPIQTPPIVRQPPVQQPTQEGQEPRDTPAAPARRVIVPAIMGLPQDRAEALVRQAGLQTGKVRGEGRVVDHTFEAGQSVAAGSVVDISLGVPPGQVATRPDPPVSQPQPPRPPVRDTLRIAPPVTNPVTAVPATQAPPTQAPVTEAPATQRVAPVTADSGAVPDVRRLALPQAQAALAAAGFSAAFDPALADSSGWMVSAQQPSPGGRLAAGGAVALLLDPPAALAGTTAAQPPLASGLQPGAPVVRQPLLERRVLWIARAALLLVAAAAAGTRRMRARARVLPIAGVSARLRMDSPARVAVEGVPFGDARLRYRMNPGRTAARVSAAGPLFVQKEISGD
jgi:beta-lactam-binding protein with PASTA domain